MIAFLDYRVLLEANMAAEAGLIILDILNLMCNTFRVSFFTLFEIPLKVVELFWIIIVEGSREWKAVKSNLPGHSRGLCLSSLNWAI